MWKLHKLRTTNYELRTTKYNTPSYIAWRRFRRNKLAFISLIFIVFTIIVAVLGYLITPDSTPYSNQQYLELATKKPGFKVKMLLVKKEHYLKSQIPDFKFQISKFTFYLKKMVWGETSEYVHIPINSYHLEGNDIIVELYNDDVQNSPREFKRYSLSTSSLQPPTSNLQISNFTFLLGTDRFGRDMLSQLILGTRVSLSVGLISVLISLLVGLFLGSVAGFFRGWIDDVIVWLINVVWSIPSLLLVIAITFALGKGFWIVFIAVGLTMWVEVARVVRGQIISIREKEYVEAARALGFRNSRIIFRHILPNVMGSVIVISAANFASAILIEAGLSFLGLGVQPPVPSWGTMIREHYSYIILGNAYLPLIPGLAIMIMVLAFMLVGNGLRDALDVKVVQST